MSSQIGTVVASGRRSATVTRKTRETEITVTLRLDGTGETKIATGVGFFDHLMSSLAYHAFFDLEIEAAGDLEIDFLPEPAELQELITELAESRLAA